MLIFISTLFNFKILNLNKYKDINKEFKSMNESREWIKNKISPILLPILKEKDYITIKDVINTLKKYQIKYIKYKRRIIL